MAEREVCETTWSALHAGLTEFGLRVTLYLDELGILGKVRHLEADHVGLRLGSVKDVDRLRTQLNGYGKLISCASVNGREICIFELYESLQVGGWRVPCVELPYPKPKHEHKDGWEHAEFVLLSKAIAIEEFREDFRRRFPELDIGHLKELRQYFESEPQADAEQLPNPTIALKSGEVTVKFHPRPIKEVVGAK